MRIHHGAARPLIASQAGVIARPQLIDVGCGRGWVAHRVRRGEWRALHPGIYLTHNGPANFAARLWGALLHAGDGALAARRTAAFLHGGDVTLRYGWAPVVGTPCAVALEVGSLLSRRGWSAQPVPCSPTCAVATVVVAAHRG